MTHWSRVFVPCCTWLVLSYLLSGSGGIWILRSWLSSHCQIKHTDHFGGLQFFNKNPILSLGLDFRPWFRLGDDFCNLHEYCLTDGWDANGEGHGGSADGERAVPERDDDREARGGGVGGGRRAPARAPLVRVGRPRAPSAPIARPAPLPAQCAGAPLAPGPRPNTWPLWSPGTLTQYLCFKPKMSRDCWSVLASEPAIWNLKAALRTRQGVRI